MTIRFFPVLATVLLGACETSVFELPPRPGSGPGVVYGQVVTVRPGRSTREPAPGTDVSLVGTSLHAIADVDGRFRLEGIVDFKGAILFRFSGEQSGGRPRQKLVRLESLGAGPGRSIAAGELAVTENARVVGRVRRGDLSARAGGHGGIRVYVPEAPYLTQTADDGSFLLDGLPEGPVIVAVWADGYAPRSVDGIDLRGGEELSLADQLLDKDAVAPANGAIRGSVRLSAPATDNELIVVTAVDANGGAHAATATPKTAESAEFLVQDLPPGLYTVLVGRRGYATAQTANIPVGAGETATLSAVVVLAPVTTPATCNAAKPCRPADPCRRGLTTCVSDVELCEQQADRLASGASCGEERVCSVDGACRRCNPGASCTPANPCHAGTMACDTGEPACHDTGTIAEAGVSCGEGAVCSAAGECLACEGGQVCDAGGCRVGAISCKSGAPECLSLDLNATPGHACGDDKVCAADGTCVDCVADAPCSPANRCRKGRRACDTGTPRCLESDELVAAGTACADDRVCDGQGACVPCIEGDACTPENPCHAGRIGCGTGAPICTDTSAPGIAGTPCAAGKVCSAAGECVACALGTLCQVSACRLGAVACDTGAPICAPNGLLALSGEGCGDGKVCDPTGTCNTCVAGGSCVPTNTCRRGAVSCSTGVQRCVETGDTTAAGTSCGQGRICDGLGGCIACNEGGDCIPENAPCEIGTIACGSGAPKCTPTGRTRAAGYQCSAGRVCSGAGTCDACSDGASCQPSGSPCKAGKIACSTGAPVCGATSIFVAAGTTCATDKVCDPTGACVSCVAGATCTPTDPCRQGAVSCATGTAVCTDAGAARPLASSCGTNKVCNAASQCVACQQGAACTPTNPCVTGTLDCASGAPVCNATASTVADGTTCGTKKVCKAGTCGTCDAGSACTPANPCHVGVVACDTGAVVCTDTTQNATDGTSCGTARACKSGICLASGLTVAAGDAQTVAPGQLLAQPVVLELRDATSNLLANKTVTLTFPAGSTVTQGTTYTTSAIGRISFNWRLGYAMGEHSLTATCASEGASVVVKATVSSPAAGTITTIANASRASALDRTNAIAALASFVKPVSLARASNGAIYVLDNGGAIRRLNPDGTSDYLAGGGTAGSPGYGDGGPGASAVLPTPRGLALDEARGQLYFDDSNILRVRSLDLATKTVAAFAGNGNYNAPPGPGYGDGGSALGASLWQNGWLGMTPDNKLLVADNNHDLMRRIDPDSGVIDSMFGKAANGCSGVPAGNVHFTGLANYDARDGISAFAPNGDLYVAGFFCYQNGSFFRGVARRDSAGRFWLAIGNPTTQTPVDGAAGALSSLSGPPAIAVDAGGNLYVADMGTSNANGSRLRRIDAGTGRARFLGGNGTAGYGGDGGPVTDALFNEPSALLFDPAGNLFIADSGNRAVRRVEKVGTSTTDSIVLTAVAGNAQAAAVTRQAALPVTLKVTDSTGANFPGATVRFRSVDDGGAVYTTSVTADASAQAQSLVRVGLKTGTYRFEATVLDLLNRPPPGGPLVFSLTATTPAVGSLFGAVNIARNDGVSRTSIAATIANTGRLEGVTVAADGTFFVADVDYHCAYRISPAGQLTLVAGTPGTPGFSGDTALATSALLSAPTDVQISADGSTLYIADSGNHRIRAVNLSSGIITTYAGGGSQGTYPSGDGGPASSATLLNPTQFALGPVDGALYFRDRRNGADRVRRIDATTGVITDFWQPTYAYCNSGAIVFSDCSYVNTEGSCNVAFDAQGNAYMTTQVCGTSLNSTNNFTWGVIKRPPGGQPTWWAGYYGGAVTTSATLRASTFEVPPQLTFDADGNAYFVERDKHRIRRYDAATGLLSPWIGNGTAGFGVEQGALSGVQLNSPRRVAMAPGGHVYIPDAANRTVRVVW